MADNPVKPDAPQTMLLNMNGADGDVECRIVAPSGREDDCFITPLGHGEHSVRLVRLINPSYPSPCYFSPSMPSWKFKRVR